MRRGHGGMLQARPRLLVFCEEVCEVVGVWFMPAFARVWQSHGAEGFS
jgi:hypothetical protein